MISLSARFAFIHIPKTAGSSIEAAVVDASCLCLSNEHHPAFRAPLNHLTLGELRRFGATANIRLDTLTTFSFVRNPWDRVISECFCPHVGPAFEPDAGIRERIHTVCDLAATGYGNHFLAQSTFLADAEAEVDHVGRFESLAADLEKICRRIGIRHRPLGRLNASAHRPYTDYYDRETRSRVASVYREDIERFGYRFGD